MWWYLWDLVSWWHFWSAIALAPWVSTSWSQLSASSGPCWCKAGSTLWTTAMARSKLALKSSVLLIFIITRPDFNINTIKPFAKIKPIPLFPVLSLINADFCVAGCLIAYGAVLGKVSPVQLMVLTLFGVTLFAVEEYIILNLIHVRSIHSLLLLQCDQTHHYHAEWKKNS